MIKWKQEVDSSQRPAAKASGKLFPETISGCLLLNATKVDRLLPSTLDIYMVCIFWWWRWDKTSCAVDQQSHMHLHTVCSHMNTPSPAVTLSSWLEPRHVVTEGKGLVVCLRVGEERSVFVRAGGRGGGGCLWGKPALGWGFCGPPPDTAARLQKKGKEIPFVLSDLTKEVFAGSGGISCSLCQNNKLSPLCNLCELLPSWCTVG